MPRYMGTGPMRFVERFVIGVRGEMSVLVGEFAF